MPELPEVETIRRSLLPLLKGKKIKSAKLTHAKLLKNAEAHLFSELLQDRIFESINRRGKYLMFHLDKDLRLLVHLRMTGQLRFEDPETELKKHNHFIIDLDNGKQLRFVDVRKFGMLYIGDEDEVSKSSGWHRLGPEPLAEQFTFECFNEILNKQRKRNIKALLLDQHMIAGLGNIYTDEALFRASIHPLSTAGKIPEQKRRALHQSIKDVLNDGIEHRGTTLNDYVDGFGKTGSFQFLLQVYGRKNELCLTCGHPIDRIKVAGRSTHFCEICQERYN
ncbi:DNA-formamidopyrimidine glycosylase [Clostridium sp. 'deep sea']|uniref:DNA-formamidopyrimidine glycosylase n=1 Tax=Clostridium sp. 'deep sea' TaxID=2779445 RepID=UPI0018964F82|nr:DNA-formamidopyrimidine glycosylase [Clostridium sp. 'deep sea']QOR36445.1 DNA-formamidopyrimidine glycosylase [Clostridium sp. 'deep sea']